MTEQEKFEAWYFPPARNQFMTEKNPDGTYVDSGTMFSWAAWQAAIASREPPKMRKATRDEKIVNPGVYEVPQKPAKE